MQQWSLTSVATTSCPTFDVDVPPTDGEASFRIYFCGRPARSTGVVNLRLLLGDHGYVLTEKRRVRDADAGGRTTDNVVHKTGDENNSEGREAEGTTGTRSTDEADGSLAKGSTGGKKVSQSTYRMCSSEGLPQGCFRVKHDRHYWVMRVGDGAPREPIPSARGNGVQMTTPSPNSTSSNGQGNNIVTRNEADGKETQKVEKLNENTEKVKRKQSRHGRDNDNAASASAPATKAARVEEIDNDDRPFFEIFKAVLEARSTSASENAALPATSPAADAVPPPLSAEVPANEADYVVGDVEATLGDLFFSSLPPVETPSQPPPVAEAPVETPVNNSEEASQRSARSRKPKRTTAGTRNDEDNKIVSEHSSSAASSRNPRRRGSLAAGATAVQVAPAEPVVAQQPIPSKNDETTRVTMKEKELESSLLPLTTSAGKHRGKREKTEAPTKQTTTSNPQQQDEKEQQVVQNPHPSKKPEPMATPVGTAESASAPLESTPPRMPSENEATSESQHNAPAPILPPNPLSSSPPSPSPSFESSPQSRLTTPPSLPVSAKTLQKTTERKKSSRKKSAREEPKSLIFPPGEDDDEENRAVKSQQRQQQPSFVQLTALTKRDESGLITTPKITSAPVSTRKSRRAEAAAAAPHTPPRSPPILPQGQRKQQQQQSLSREKIPSPPIRSPPSLHAAPLLPFPLPRTPSADYKSQHSNNTTRDPEEKSLLHGQRRGSPSNADANTSPTVLYSNRSSGLVTSSQQEQHIIPYSPSAAAVHLPAPLSVHSANGSTRPDPLTSRHLRQHQQQFAETRGSGDNGNGGSPQYSETSSFSIFPQESPALGFTQVHNTLAEEFSLDPSEPGSSSIVSEYLYDMEE